MEEAKILLFGPRSGKSLHKLYPEIAQNPKFRIPMEDVLFAWYVGCKTSPVDQDWTDKVKYQSAALAAIKDESKRRKYGNGEIPQPVREAIEAFSKFEPNARMKAKKILQKMMYDYEKYVDVDIEKDFDVQKIDKEGNTTIETDWAARKQYIDGTEKIMKNMPTLISQLEEGFGITEEKGKEEGIRMIDKFHIQNRES